MNKGTQPPLYSTNKQSRTEKCFTKVLNPPFYLTVGTSSPACPGTSAGWTPRCAASPSGTPGSGTSSSSGSPRCSCVPSAPVSQPRGKYFAGFWQCRRQQPERNMSPVIQNIININVNNDETTGLYTCRDVLHSFVCASIMLSTLACFRQVRVSLTTKPNNLSV